MFKTYPGCDPNNYLGGWNLDYRHYYLCVLGDGSRETGQGESEQGPAGRSQALGLRGLGIKEPGTCEWSCVDGARGQETGLLAANGGPNVGFAQPGFRSLGLEKLHTVSLIFLKDK